MMEIRLMANSWSGLTNSISKSATKVTCIRKFCQKIQRRYEKPTSPKCEKAAKRHLSTARKVAAMQMTNLLTISSCAVKKNFLITIILCGLSLAILPSKKVGITRTCSRYVWCAKATAPRIAAKQLAVDCAWLCNRLEMNISARLMSKSISW